MLGEDGKLYRYGSIVEESVIPPKFRKKRYYIKGITKLRLASPVEEMVVGELNINERGREKGDLSPVMRELEL
jgi:hypothetical protein